MRRGWIVFLLLLIPALLGAQTLPITSYTARYYAQGASAPMQTNTILASAVTCNLTPTPNLVNVNPTLIEWDDIANAGKICRVDQSATFLAFPLGNYEGTLAATNSAGTGQESNKAPFVKANVPSAPANLKVGRPASGT